MNERNNMVIYDQWSYMTMFGTLGVVFIALGEGIQIELKCLWLADTQFSYSGAQCAAVEPKDYCGPVLAAHFQIGLLKYPDNTDLIFIIANMV